MSNTNDAVLVDNITKFYKVNYTKIDRFKEWFIPGFSLPPEKIKKVLSGISFRVKRGEAVGIIGMNGAGKSTLLKIITGTVIPSTGAVSFYGRVAALLELGMGMHPDFTGRQNILMMGQLVGMSVQEIQQKMTEIEDFAEIGTFIDEPVRTYSSGMQVRLAFSIATAVRPDILIVDEALSVGDAYFQQKSFQKIKEFKEQGTTLLFVSHDMQAVQTICDRAILLHHGSFLMEGLPATVIDYYNALIAERQNQTVEQRRLGNDRIATISGTGEAVIESIYLLNRNREKIEVVSVGQEVIIQANIHVLKKVPKLVFGFAIKNRLGVVMFGTNTWYHDCCCDDVQPGRLTIEAQLRMTTGTGEFSLTVALTSSETHLINNYQWKDLALIFTVINTSKPFFVGDSFMDTKFSIIPGSDDIV